MESQIQLLKSKIQQEKAYLIGICGIPGAGKSTLAQKLHHHLPKSIIIPMDGYHLYRKDLDEQGLKYRGAPSTFDLTKFKEKMLEVRKRNSFPIYFPSFDHAVKDPIENDIKLTEEIEHVIVEGLYLFDKSLELEGCWDLKIWLEGNLESCLERLVKRNFEAGLSPSLQACRLRTFDSDKNNAVHVLQHSERSKCVVVDNHDQ